jgi:hypothetical protein
MALLLAGIFLVIQKFAIHPSPQHTATAQTAPPPQEALPPPPDIPAVKEEAPKTEEPKKEDPPAADKTETPKPEIPKTEAAKPAPRTAAQQKPSAEFDFQVTTSPVAASVTFDGDPSTKCKSPCNISLPGGRHTFVAQHPGYRDAHRIIEVPRDGGLIVDLAKQMGSLSLITNPPGLTVIVDGKEQPQKTPANLNLAIGPHRVQVMKGAEKQEFTIDIRDGLLSSKFIEWTQ